MSSVQYQAQLENYLRQFHLPTFAQNYQAFAQDAARTGLSCERYWAFTLHSGGRAARRTPHGTLYRRCQVPCHKGPVQLRFRGCGKCLEDEAAC